MNTKSGDNLNLYSRILLTPNLKQFLLLYKVFSYNCYTINMQFYKIINVLNQNLHVFI